MSPRMARSCRREGTPVKWTVEESWFFRLSAYQDRLLAHYEANPGFIRAGHAAERGACASSRAGCNDLSISRTSFDWGIKVPGSRRSRHVCLAGRADQLLDRRRISRRYRCLQEVLASRPSYHRQGCGALPHHLLAGLPDVRRDSVAETGVRPRLPAPPRQKMSKSLGNVVDPLELIDAFGVWTSCATSCCARSPSARTAAIAPRRSSPRSMPIWPTVRKSRPAHALLHRQEFRWKAAGGRKGTEQTPPCSPRPRGDAGRGAGPVRGAGAQRRHRGLAEGRFRLQSIYRRAGAMGAAQDRPERMTAVLATASARRSLTSPPPSSRSSQASASKLLDTMGVPADQRT